MTEHPSTDMLAQHVSGLVGRYTALSAERTEQARGHKAEASYLYGAAAAFEVVATELREALGQRAALPSGGREGDLPASANWFAETGRLKDGFPKVSLDDADLSMASEASHE